MKHYLAVFFLLFFYVPELGATDLKGTIREPGSGDPAVGASLHLLELAVINDATGLDGSFHLRNIPAGIYHLRITYTGYGEETKEIVVKDEELQVLNITLASNGKKVLDEVEISAVRDGSAEHTARNVERDAAQVVNVVSGKAIQLSPDLTVANVVQRVSGVSLERNSNGDGQFAILRGMDKRYNYTLVNGIKIPSPDNKYRYVPLDIFPADLLDRLEVYKALTPSMEGDAIGGAINLVMKDAPSDFLCTVNFATGYSELFLQRDFAGYDFKNAISQSPYELNGKQYAAQPGDFPASAYDYTYKKPAPNLLGGLVIGNRFLNKRLGIILAGSYQQTSRGSNSTFNDFENVDTFSGVTLTKYSQRQYSERQIRSGVHAKADFRFNAANKIQWYNAYLNLDNVQLREVQTTQLTIGGYDPENGNATLGYATRTRFTHQQIYNSTLQGEHLLFSEKFKLDWSAVYSKAEQQMPDMATLPLLGERRNFLERKTYVQDATRRWEHNSDRDVAAYLNLAYNNSIAGRSVTWTIGGLYRDKVRDNFYNQYQLRPSNLQALYGVDFNDYRDIAWVVQNPRGSVGSALNYDAYEKIAAGFFQFMIKGHKTEITGGLRAEHTAQGYAMKFPIGEDRPDGEQIYTDLLPSLHLRYRPQKHTNIRASYFRSLNRPGFFELVPYKIVNEEYQERGNPDLQRAVADNIDFRYELYPGSSEQFMAGVFYKRIKNPIEYTLQRDVVRGQDIFYGPGNFGTAQNYGLELDAIKYFKKIGFKANYTYTHSAITTPKSKRVRNERTNGNLETIQVDQTRPLYGQAAHIANLSLLYKDVKRGWDIQLAGNYTGSRIATVSQFVDNDLWQKAFVQLDFSLEKRFGQKWNVFAKANNLLNTPMEVYVKGDFNNMKAVPEQDLADRVLIRRDFYQRSYVLGLRYKL